MTTAEAIAQLWEALDCPNLDAPMHTAACNWCAGVAPARAALDFLEAEIERLTKDRDFEYRWRCEARAEIERLRADHEGAKAYVLQQELQIADLRAELEFTTATLAEVVNRAAALREAGEGLFRLWDSIGYAEGAKADAVNAALARWREVAGEKEAGDESS